MRWIKIVMTVGLCLVALSVEAKIENLDESTYFQMFLVALALMIYIGIRLYHYWHDHHHH